MDFTPRDTYQIFEELHTLSLSSSATNGKNICSFNDHYNDVNLFTHLVNGWELPCYTEHHKLLEIDHIKFYQVYPKYKGARKSAMNGQYLLLKLVQRRNISHRIENFKLAETEKILIDNDRTCSLVFTELERLRLESENPDNDMPWSFMTTT